MVHCVVCFSNRLSLVFGGSTHRKSNTPSVRSLMVHVESTRPGNWLQLVLPVLVSALMLMVG